MAIWTLLMEKNPNIYIGHDCKLNALTPRLQYGYYYIIEMIKLLKSENPFLLYLLQTKQEIMKIRH